MAGSLGRRSAVRILAGLGIVLFAVAPAAAVKRRVFATSVQGTGDLSTWPEATGATAFARADAICRARAVTATPTPLPNAATYRAWISTSTTDAYCHVQGLSGKKDTGCGGGTPSGGGPWYLANGITAFAAKLELPRLGGVKDHDGFDAHAAVLGSAERQDVDPRAPRHLGGGATGRYDGVGETCAVHMNRQPFGFCYCRKGRDLIGAVKRSGLGQVGQAQHAVLSMVDTAMGCQCKAGLEICRGNLAVCAVDRRCLATADVELGCAAFIHFDMRFFVAIDCAPGRAEE